LRELGGRDSARQKFTLKERDNETGLDYSIHRYYATTQGRFTSPDPYVIFFEMKRGRDSEEQIEMLNEYTGVDSSGLGANVFVIASAIADGAISGWSYDA